jgi:hypothetical protein
MTTTTQTKGIKPAPEGLGCPEPPVAVDCPPWCTLPQGHDYSSLDAEHYQVRFHRLSFGDENGGTFLDVGCDGTWRGDHEELSPIDVRIWLDGNGVGVPLTRTRALELRELLLQAAQFMSMAETLD